MTEIELLRSICGRLGLPPDTPIEVAVYKARAALREKGVDVRYFHGATSCGEWSPSKGGDLHGHYHSELAAIDAALEKHMPKKPAWSLEPCGYEGHLHILRDGGDYGRLPEADARAFVAMKEAEHGKA